MNEQGWIKLYRSIWENPIVTKDPGHLAVWIYLLTHAAHTEHDVEFKGVRRTLKAGQLLTGRKILADRLKVNEYRAARILKTFENAQQITREPSSKCTLVTLVNWNIYQKSEQESAQRMHSSRTPDAQRVHTEQERKELKNERNLTDDSMVSQVIALLNQESGKAFKASAQETQRLVRARCKEGYGYDDFAQVIRCKCSQWKGSAEMGRYLRPQTLFGGKFDSYLQEAKSSPKQDAQITLARIDPDMMR